MRLFAVVLIISILVHIGILLLPLPEKKLKKNEVVPVSIIEIKKEEVQKKAAPQPKKVVEQKNIPTEQKEPVKKEEPNKKEAPRQENVKKQSEQKQASVQVDNKKPDVKNQTAAKENKKEKAQEKPVEKQVEEKPFRPKGADDPLVLPDINVPLTTNMDIPEVKLPDIPKPNIPNEMVENQRELDVANELASLKSSESGASYNNKQEVANQVKQEAASAGSKTATSSNLYNFDIAPSGNRKVVYVPKDPVFALANDTYVTIKFNIDKQGNTYNIAFVTRSSVDVEKLAYDYVNSMKFDAIIEDRDDFAQITMYFKVQK